MGLPIIPQLLVIEMRFLRFWFSKLSDTDKLTLVKLRENQLTSNQVKDYLIKNVQQSNWFVCKKISTYTFLFKYFRSFWTDVIPEIQRTINSNANFSLKQLYYLTKFLHTISYEPSTKEDKKFIKKLLAVLGTPEGIVVLQSIRLPKEIIAPKLPQIEKTLGDLQDNINGITFHRILKNGALMQYWSSDFTQRVLASTKYELPWNTKRILRDSRPQVQKQTKRNEDGHRSKVEIIFQEYLSELGYIFENNVFIGLYEIDFLINDKIVVEFNGNHHYCSNNFKELNVKNKIKKEILENSGYIVINLDLQEWNQIAKSGNRSALDKKLQHICTLIETTYISYLQASKTLQ